MKVSLTFTDSISGVPYFITGLEQSEFSFVRADNHSSAIGFSYFQEIGDGQYEFGDFDVPEVSLNTGQWTDSVIVVLPRINGTIQEGFSEIPVYNDAYIPVTKGDLVQRKDRLGDTEFGRTVWDPSLSAVLGYDAFNPTQDQYYRFTVPVIGWIEDKFASSGFNGAYLPLSGGQLNGNVTANMATFTLVQTNINGFAASANLKKVSSSSMHIYNNLGTFPTGDHFTYGYFNTDAENVPVFSMGCGVDELPYIDFHNRQIKNFNANISMASYMPLTGGVFSGSVTANGPRFQLGNTAFGSKGTTGEFANVTLSGLTANQRGIHIKSNLGIVTAGDLLSVFYSDTNPDNHLPFRVGADSATELPYIVLDASISSNQFTTSTPSTSLLGGIPATYMGANAGSMLGVPDKWIEITESNGVTYLVPAFLKP